MNDTEIKNIPSMHCPGCGWTGPELEGINKYGIPQCPDCYWETKYGPMPESGPIKAHPHCPRCGWRGGECGSPDELIEWEIRNAKFAHPEWPTDPIHAFAIVAEEFGEAAKEVLQLTYEPTKSTVERIRTETIQLAAMCHRFLESLDRYEFKPSAQHEQK